jgi:hypothetical protein
MKAKESPRPANTPTEGQQTAVPTKTPSLLFDFVTRLAENAAGDAYSALMLADYLLVAAR